MQRVTSCRFSIPGDQAESMDHRINCANTLIGSGTDEHQRKQLHHLLVSRHEHATYIKFVLSFRKLLHHLYDTPQDHALQTCHARNCCIYAWQVFTSMTHHKIMELQTCDSGNCSICVASVHLYDTPQDHGTAECLLAMHMVIHAKHHTLTIGSDALVCAVIHLHTHNM